MKKRQRKKIYCQDCIYVAMFGLKIDERGIYKTMMLKRPKCRANLIKKKTALREYTDWAFIEDINKNNNCKDFEQYFPKPKESFFKQIINSFKGMWSIIY